MKACWLISETKETHGGIAVHSDMIHLAEHFKACVSPRHCSSFGDLISRRSFDVFGLRRTYLSRVAVVHPNANAGFALGKVLLRVARSFSFKSLLTRALAYQVVIKVMYTCQSNRVPHDQYP